MESFKANQFLQNTTTQVINQINNDAFKDKATITYLRNQNIQFLLQVGKRNDDTALLRNVVKDLQQVATKLSSSANSPSTSSYGLKKPECYCYCWTRGRAGDKRRTSTTCDKPRSGYQKEATISNRMRGSSSEFTSRR